MKILNFKKFFWLASLLAVFSFQFALAESEIPENLAPLAEELGCQTKEECAKAFDSNFEKGIELAEKYQVYSKEQSDIAQSYKQEVISKLSNITEENFEEEIVKIAKELLKKPNLAKTFQLDKDTVTAAETIVTEVKNAGVGVDICSQSAETLSREQLIGCLEASKKLAKKTNIVQIQKYIPRGVIEKTNMADMAASLDEALAKGDYPELGKTAEEAGQKCLKSGSESLKSCDEIAQKFFGPEGVKELAAARARTKQAGDFYLKGLENLELLTSDGRKIAGKTAIKDACEKAFETGDVKLARSCGEFAVKNGFTSQKEMDDGLKIFESMADKNINFDQCRSNPELCQEFIPEEHRKEFEGNKKIYEIMKAEAGFNPVECEKGNVDFEIGRKCFEASQKALPKLKEIAADYPEVQRMVSEIEFGIKREGEQKQKGDDFGKFFSQQAGPGGCKNEEECFAYCNDPAHGAECISFGAKHEVFQGDEAVERYQKYNQNNLGGPGPAGPSPECFAAIQSGDFVKAKEVCSVPANPYQYQPSQPPYQVNPNYQQSSISSYPNYDEKEKCYRNGGFWTGNYCDYQNRSASSYSSYSYSSYGYAGSCPSDLANLLGTGCHFMYNDSSNTAVYCNGEMTKSAKAGDTATTEGCSSGNYSSYSYSSYPSSAYSSYSYSSYPSSAYSSYSYTPPSGQKEQVWNSYGLRSWIRTDADSARIENLKQVCANVTSSAWDIWLPGAGNYNSQDFGMPDEAKCRSWTPSSSSYSSYTYSSYPSSAYSSYSYSSYPSYSSCANEMVSLLGTGCHFMYNDSSNTAVYCNGEMTKSAKAGDTATAEGCSSGNYSSYSYSSYPSSAYSSYSYSPPSGQKEQVWNSYGLRSWIRTDADSARIENLKQVCANVTSSAWDIWLPGAGNYNSQDFGMPDEAKCRSWTPSSSSYSSYTYSSYPSSAYSSYSYSSYPSYSSCANEMVSLLGTGCHFMYNDSSNTAVYCNGEMTKSAKAGDTATAEGCSSGNYSSYSYSSYPSSAYSSYSYSSYSPASSEAAYSSYSSAAYSSAAYSSYDPSSSCTQAGGTWDGSVCQMPNSGSSSSVTQNPAAAGWLFGKIINFFSR